MSPVSIVRCPDYETKKVEDAVFRSVELVGGIGRFVKKGGKTLIKPNLLSARKPDEAVTTHPEVIRCVIRLVKKAGGVPVVGDSPGNFFTVTDVDLVYEKTGVKRIAEEEGAGLVRFDEPRHINGYPIAREAADASAVISLPKLKTHSLTVMTGAVKNTFGMVPGLFKVECHRKKPKPKEFVKIIVDVFEAARPALSIMDGITGMEGDGPAAGPPKRVGLILASPDAVSLDAVVAQLVGLQPHRDITTREAERRGAGKADIGAIKVLGESIETARVNDFKLPKTAHAMDMVPNLLIGLFSRAVDFRPVIDEKICTKCRVCVNSCPVNAITINEEKSHIDNALCVRCFCCHEVCPHRAISIKKKPGR